MTNKPTPQNQGFAPMPLVLHLEAANMGDLMDMLDRVMAGLNPGNVGAARINTQPGAASVDVDLYPSEADADAAAAAAAAAAPKKRGRPAKAAKVEDEGETPEAPEAEDDEAPADSALKTLTSAEARTKGIEMVQKHFAANPDSLPAITQMTQKYGVRHFADVPDEKAHEFLADVAMLANGTAAA